MFKNIDLTNVLFFTLTPLAAIILVPLHLHYYSLSIATIVWALVYGALSEMSVTAGYHRCFSHLAFKVRTPLKLFLLIVSAGAFQGPALKWATDHRRHHRRVDSDEDPYAITKGFFYAHMGWIFLKDDPRFVGKYEADLLKDKWIVLQNKIYTPLAIFMCFIFPAIISGLAWGDWIGGFIYAGVVRCVVNHHATFFINSACHVFGRQTYGDENSAKDSLVMAFLTFGEGYHNFHHHFQADYRNGVRWYDWDPTKWAIDTFAKIRLAYDLKTYPAELLLKSRLKFEEKQIAKLGQETSRLTALRERIESAQKHWNEARRRYQDERCQEFRAELKKAKAEVRRLQRHWGQEIRMLRLQAQSAY